MSGASTASSALAVGWARAAELLGFEIVAPFSLQLSSGAPLNAAVLVKGFGYRNGMLIVTEFDTVAARVSELVNAGFGFSVMSEPKARHPFVLDAYVDVLSDWGWAGRQEDAPAWLAERRHED